MIDAKTPIATPEPPQDEPETEPAPDVPLSTVDAWANVLQAVSRIDPPDDLTRSVARRRPRHHPRRRPHVRTHRRSPHKSGMVSCS